MVSPDNLLTDAQKIGQQATSCYFCCRLRFMQVYAWKAATVGTPGVQRTCISFPDHVTNFLAAQDT